MTIQEFSQQLGREDHPSHMIQVLQTIQGFDVEQIIGPNGIGGDWTPWSDEKPRT
jgi:hypothetical protein